MLLDETLCNIKLADFGIADFVDPRHPCLCKSSGSLLYMAPEVLMRANGENYNAFCADVWSMGVVLYAMFVHKLPFVSSDPTSLLRQVFHFIFTTIF